MRRLQFQKKDFPVDKIRRFLEPGPIVLVSSSWPGRRNIMTMGWHAVMETEPSLVGSYTWDVNFSRELVSRSGECVINIPTADMAEKVVKIGNCSGRDIDKFAAFHLSAQRASRVQAPLIKECYANFECKV